MSLLPKKHRDPLELMLDDGFSNAEVAKILRDAGFVVHEFVDVFPRERDPTKREESIPDPPIIQVCHSNSWLLVTTDKDMCKKHRTTIRKHRNVTVIATASNGACLPPEWAHSIVLLKERIEHEFGNRRRPWFLFFNRQGKITANRDRMF